MGSAFEQGMLVPIAGLPEDEDLSLPERQRLSYVVGALLSWLTEPRTGQGIRVRAMAVLWAVYPSKDETLKELSRQAHTTPRRLRYAALMFCGQFGIQPANGYGKVKGDKL
jgi:hypothetical protein